MSTVVLCDLEWTTEGHMVSMKHLCVWDKGHPEKHLCSCGEEKDK